MRTAILALLLVSFAKGIVVDAQVRASDEGTRHAAAPGDWPLLHIADPVARRAARNALDLAWERLSQEDCQHLLTAFSDQSGSPLGMRLRARAPDPQTYLTMLTFIDGSRERPCSYGLFAFTRPGDRVIWVCVEELKREWQQDQEHAVARFIHEMLHSLGLGENPPTSAEITRRVLAACGRRRD